MIFFVELRQKNSKNSKNKFSQNFKEDFEFVFGNKA